MKICEVCHAEHPKGHAHKKILTVTFDRNPPDERVDYYTLESNVSSNREARDREKSGKIQTKKGGCCNLF
jgi:hypothetical protein